MPTLEAGGLYVIYPSWLDGVRDKRSTSACFSATLRRVFDFIAGLAYEDTR
jgi:hypothetical protein